jgi:hypothetical protein
MPFENIPFQVINWGGVPKTEHTGETGMAFWQTLSFQDLRIRLVEYSKDYLPIIGVRMLASFHFGRRCEIADY